MRLKLCKFPLIHLLVVVALSFVHSVHCQGLDDAYRVDDAAVRLLNEQISNATDVLSSEVGSKSNFCIKDSQADWDRTFNYSSNMEFLASCIKKTRGDITQRVCTAAEVKFYFDNFFESGNANYLKPNKNCNLTSWVSGCEPGWACSVGPTEQLDFKNSQETPERTLDCQSCCEGFFCPRGITCMIPCPLGSYCPLATPNTVTGTCEPYHYQLPPGNPNHTCGGAHIWADVRQSSEVFCSAGSYCPTTTQKYSCSTGHYCRMGSSEEKRCFKLTSCDPNTANQNIHAYGIMLLAALSTLLLIIYNCSDQVLAAREKRLAKTRDAAAVSARLNVKLREGWKVDKDASIKHSNGFQAHFSRTFSRKRDITDVELHKILNQGKPETDDEVFLTVHPSVSYTSISLSVQSSANVKEHSEHMEIAHKIENDPDKIEGINLETTDKKIKKNVPKVKGKEMDTRSQIFKYAYAQLEKEKALQQEQINLTFSRVLSLAANTEFRTRPLIEISFKDLSLTLKAKNKHLLRSVTGNIKPGHITAVMGPSGAGKTTFLSAVAGKAIGCTTTGLILINGKKESIHSYKKIIGFVPQDDIVHGNLTVEENLWFSAKCRLSADLSKRDKVLVVERVIESLGLQTVRDSLVGTVENRGISGGQRKRVNVGLEMVMEPSLLILDEPTSGLDSASSQLLLRALRREALEGVNVCMVVHQPSYALFKMFDDLILLAKGGLTVYHGPAIKVEEYFASLGITIPERINPPDHFIDILEGIVVPDRSTCISYEDLPIRWMLHNGYPIPSDMQQNAAGLSMSLLGIPPTPRISDAPIGMEDQSFAGELWQDVKSTVDQERDKIRLNFLKTEDLSKRRTPGVFHQYRYFLGRVGKQRLREAKLQAVDYLILLLAGACLGSLAKVSDATFGMLGYTYTIIAVSLLCKIAALRSFSLDRLHFWRERASGMSSLAYFLSKDTIDHFNTVIKPAVYLSMFYFFTNPRSSFTENYIVLLCLVYCVTGIAYAFAIFFESGAAQLWSVLVPVVTTLIATQPNGSSLVNDISKFCYSKWALEAFVISNAERYYGVWLITRCGSLMKAGYNLHDWGLCLFLLISTGIISRVIAFIYMVTFQKR